MRETHDTIDGLLAEFRGYSYGMPPSYHVTMSWHDFRVMLDRFEAAHKREVAEVAGLATKYRTALSRINALATYCCQPNVREQIIEQCEIIFAAERNGKTKEAEAANGK